MKLITGVLPIAFIVSLIGYPLRPTTQPTGAVRFGLLAKPAASVTFAKDIAPVVFAHCATCHRPEGSAPFSLLTYADVREHAEKIAELSARRFCTFPRELSSRRVGRSPSSSRVERRDKNGR